MRSSIEASCYVEGTLYGEACVFTAARFALTAAQRRTSLATFERNETHMDGSCRWAEGHAVRRVRASAHDAVRRRGQAPLMLQGVLAPGAPARAHRLNLHVHASYALRWTAGRPYKQTRCGRRALGARVAVRRTALRRRFFSHLAHASLWTACVVDTSCRRMQAIGDISPSTRPRTPLQQNRPGHAER